MHIIASVLKTLLLILFSSPELSSGSISVCLSWTANDDMIEFKCRVNLLELTVTFCNQFNKTVASCMFPIRIDKPECNSLFRNSSIVQDFKTNITTLIVRGHITNKVNGAWSCYHGTNRGNATVIVTGWIEDKRCWQEYSSWTYAGIICSVVMSCIVQLIYTFFRSRCNGIDALCKILRNMDENRSEASKTCFVVVKVLVCVCVLIFPLVYGCIGSGSDCTHQEALFVCGFGIIPFFGYLGWKNNMTNTNQEYGRPPE